MVGSTLCAALNLDRLIGGARAVGRPENSEICAQVVPHQVPFLTDDARQLGRGRVCACPYQGASRGCRLRSGATLISKRRQGNPTLLPGALVQFFPCIGLERATSLQSRRLSPGCSLGLRHVGLLAGATVFTRARILAGARI